MDPGEEDLREVGSDNTDSETVGLDYTRKSLSTSYMKRTQCKWLHACRHLEAESDYARELGICKQSEACTFSIRPSIASETWPTGALTWEFDCIAHIAIAHEQGGCA